MVNRAFSSSFPLPPGVRAMVPGSRATIFGICLSVLAAPGSATASTLPPGFTETLVAGGLVRPTAMAIAPDGRIFVCQQNGQLRVIRDGALLDEPFHALSVNFSGG